MHQGADGAEWQQDQVKHQVDGAGDQGKREQDNAHDDEANWPCDQRRQDEQEKRNDHAGLTQRHADFVATMRGFWT